MLQNVNFLLVDVSLVGGPCTRCIAVDTAPGRARTRRKLYPHSTDVDTVPDQRSPHVTCSVTRYGPKVEPAPV